MGIRPRISTRDAACAGPTRRFSKTTPAQSQGRLREILGELLPDQAEAGSRDHGSPRDLLAPPSKDGATRPPRRASDRAPTGTGRGGEKENKGVAGRQEEVRKAVCSTGSDGRGDDLGTTKIGARRNGQDRQACILILHIGVSVVLSTQHTPLVGLSIG